MLNSANPQNMNGENSSSPTTPTVLDPKTKDATSNTEGENTRNKSGGILSNKATEEAELKQPDTKVSSPTPTQTSEPPQSQPPPPTNFMAHNNPFASPLHEFAPKILVVGVGGAGNNALNNMIAKELHGVDFLALNTDAQHLSTSLTDQRLQMGIELTRGLGAGANPDAGRMYVYICIIFIGTSVVCFYIFCYDSGLYIFFSVRYLFFLLLLLTPVLATRYDFLYAIPFQYSWHNNLALSHLQT